MASANRAVRGDFKDGVVLIDNVLVVAAGMEAEESSEADRARTAYCIFGLWLSDMLSDDDLVGSIV